MPFSASVKNDFAYIHSYGILRRRTMNPSRLLRTAVCIACTAVSLCSFVPTTATEVTNVSAVSSVLIGADTLEILFSKDAHRRMPMASTTKLMTALILSEQRTPYKTVTVTKEAVCVEGTSMGLAEGDSVSYYGLLVGMLLSSGNDAANAAAISVAGSVEKFAELMNEKAAALGMVNSRFVTPSGLDSDGHYSTAYDMALLASAVLKDSTLKGIVSSEALTVSFGNPPYDRRLYNHNKLLSRYEYCIGLKTGFTKKSGRCLVSAAKKNGCTVIAVTLNAPDDWNDHIKLLDYGLDRLKSKDITYSFEDDTLPVVGAAASRIRIEAEHFACGCTENTLENMTVKAELLPFVYSPVTPGQTVGRVDYYINGSLIHSSKIYSLADVEVYTGEQSFLKRFKRNIIKLVSAFI